MNYSSRFWLYAPITTFLLIAAAVMAYWWVAADALEKKLAALKGHEAIPGITLDWSKVEVGGFPFRLDADFTGFTVKGAGAHGPFAWSSEEFAAHTLTYNRAKAVYEAAGRQHVSWTDAGGAAHGIDFLTGATRASSVTRAQSLVRADLDIATLVGKDTRISRFQFHMRRDLKGNSLDLVVQADNWDSKKLVQAYATLNKAAALMPLLSGDAPWPTAVAAWKAQGGSAKLTRTSEPALAEAALSALY